MATKCPRCGSKNTECINRGKQVGGFILKVGAAVACNIIGAMVGHPNAGKNIGGLFAGPPEDSVYKCNSCGKTFKP